MRAVVFFHVNNQKQKKSRLSDSNLKNCLWLSVTNLTPNITGLVKAKQSQK